MTKSRLLENWLRIENFQLSLKARVDEYEKELDLPIYNWGTPLQI